MSASAPRAACARARSPGARARALRSPGTRGRARASARTWSIAHTCPLASSWAPSATATSRAWVISWHSHCVQPPGSRPRPRTATLGVPHAARHHAALGGLGHLVARGTVQPHRPGPWRPGGATRAREDPWAAPSQGATRAVMGGAVHRRDVQDVCRAPCCEGGLAGRRGPIGERARVRVGKRAHAHLAPAAGAPSRQRAAPCSYPLRAPHRGAAPCARRPSGMDRTRALRWWLWQPLRWSTRSTRLSGAQPASASLRARWRCAACRSRRSRGSSAPHSPSLLAPTNTSTFPAALGSTERRPATAPAPQPSARSAARSANCSKHSSAACGARTRVWGRMSHEALFAVHAATRRIVLGAAGALLHRHMRVLAHDPSRPRELAAERKALHSGTPPMRGILLARVPTPVRYTRARQARVSAGGGPLLTRARASGARAARWRWRRAREGRLARSPLLTSRTRSKAGAAHAASPSNVRCCRERAAAGPAAAAADTEAAAIATDEGKTSSPVSARRALGTAGRPGPGRERGPGAAGGPALRRRRRARVAPGGARRRPLQPPRERDTRDPRRIER